MRKRIGTTGILAAFLALLPVALVIYWQSRNLGFTDADSNRYMRIMMLGFYQYRSVGLFAGFARAYQEITTGTAGSMIHPFIAVLFAIFRGGSVLGAVALHNVFYFVLFLTYIFAFSSEFLPPIRSAAVVLGIGTMPYVFQTTYLLMPELPLLAAEAAALYHLYKSDFFTRPKHFFACAFFAGLAVCFRPAEASLLLFCPLLITLLFALQRKVIAFRDVSFVIGLILVLLFELNGVTRSQSDFSSQDIWLRVLPIYVLGFSAILASKKLRLNRAFVVGFSIFILELSTWLVPLGKQFFEWAWGNSYGAISSHHFATLQVLHRMGEEMLGIPFTLLLLAAILAPVSAWKKSIRFWVIGSAVAAMCISLFTYNPDTRYQYGPVSVLCMVLLVLGMSKTKAREKLRMSLVAAAILFQLVVVISKTAGRGEGFLQKWAPESYLSALRVPDRSEPPQMEIVRSLRRQLPPGERLAIRIVQPQVYEPMNAYTEPDLLYLTAQPQGLDWSFERHAMASTQINEMISELSPDEKYLLVGPADLSLYDGADPLNDSNVTPFQMSLRQTREILTAASERRLKRVGLEEIGRVPISYGNYHSEFLLIKVIPRKSQIRS